MRSEIYCESSAIAQETSQRIEWIFTSLNGLLSKFSDYRFIIYIYYKHLGLLAGNSNIGDESNY
ncbi:hypothetical protein TWF106_007161 [Orbilia oligospora]|uniref:Uncharacterized protein n=1 Tax=Orbilia oligospora TaxID=2813651 RepID=A0A7C8UKT8_ORBOL|nr:hypothetical protein TWF106_007161 [Orbilia oligospora]